MGRHSAPDEAEDSPAAPGAVVARPVSGRHHDAGAAAEDSADTEQGSADPPGSGTASTEVLALDPGERSATPDTRTRPKPRVESGTHGDLQLLRERPALRARCAAAAIVPFLLYTAVLAVIGRADVYLLWVWIPTVTAGIAVGGFLDAAHRRKP